MKKILLYTDTPQVGGAELQMFLLAKFLDKNLFTPILCCSNFKSLDRWCENFEKEGIKIYRLNVRNKHDPRHFFQLRKIIKDEKIDILHLNLWNPGSCRYAFLAAKNTPIIVTEHDPFELSSIKNYFKKSQLKKALKIVAISDNNKKLLNKLYPEHRQKIEVIHNGIDTTWWQSQLLRFTEDDREKIKEQIFQTRENTLIITTIAELHERKGINYLIDATPELINEFPNIKFIIIGEGKERKNLENQIKKLKVQDHVLLIGKQKNIPQLLKSSDIFVLPSRREGFGLVNLEAMITGIPVIASKVGGIPEIIEDVGILVEPENPKGLYKALKLLISSQEKRSKLAEAGKKRVIEKFDAEEMAKNYEKIYHKILK